MRIGAAALQRVAATIIEAAGSSAEEAGQVAARLVEANLTGHDSHGVIRVPQYVDAVREGAVIPNRHAALLSETEVAVVLDGQFGYGQVVGAQAVEAAIAKAKRHGVGLAALRNSGHLGRIGDWAELAAAAGMTSLHFVNVVGVALRGVPHGGRDPRGTTNPIAIGMPREGAPPIILDFATTAVAAGKVMVARDKHEQLPPNSAMDRDGRPTTDPNALSQGGALLPFGGHKGYALSLMAVLLSTVLVRENAPGESGAEGGKVFFCAVDAGVFGTGAPDAAAAVFEQVRAVPPAEGFEAVLIPGDPERRSAARRLAEGVPVAEDTWGAVKATAAELGVSI
jgi:LDH2 family malate/lactate/ureidoglycolate dehydrogenase